MHHVVPGSTRARSSSQNKSEQIVAQVITELDRNEVYAEAGIRSARARARSRRTCICRSRTDLLI